MSHVHLFMLEQPSVKYFVRTPGVSVMCTHCPLVSVPYHGLRANSPFLKKQQSLHEEDRQATVTRIKRLTIRGTVVGVQFFSLSSVTLLVSDTKSSW